MKEFLLRPMYNRLMIALFSINFVSLFVYQNIFLFIFLAIILFLTHWAGNERASKMQLYRMISKTMFSDKAASLKELESQHKIKIWCEEWNINNLNRKERNPKIRELQEYIKKKTEEMDKNG